MPATTARSAGESRPMCNTNSSRLQHCRDRRKYCSNIPITLSGCANIQITYMVHEYQFILSEYFWSCVCRRLQPSSHRTSIIFGQGCFGTVFRFCVSGASCHESWWSFLATVLHTFISTCVCGVAVALTYLVVGVADRLYLALRFWKTVEEQHRLIELYSSILQIT